MHGKELDGSKLVLNFQWGRHSHPSSVSQSGSSKSGNKKTRLPKKNSRESKQNNGQVNDNKQHNGGSSGKSQRHNSSPSTQPRRNSRRRSHRKGPRSFYPSRQLYVGNVDFSMTVEQELLALFAVFGAVEGIKFFPDRNFAFVVYYELADAVWARAQMMQYPPIKADGSILAVNFGRVRKKEKKKKKKKKK